MTRSWSGGVQRPVQIDVTVIVGSGRRTRKGVGGPRVADIGVGGLRAGGVGTVVTSALAALGGELAHLRSISRRALVSSAQE